LKNPRLPQAIPGIKSGGVKATCLYLATKLGDIMDELVVVGASLQSDA